MRNFRDPDVLIRAFLEDGTTELPDSSYDVVRASIENARQRVVIGPWREDQVTRYATFAIAATAVVLAAVVGFQLLPGAGSDVGGPPGATSTPAPTLASTATPPPTLAPTATPALTPSPVPTPIPDPSGRLEPGTYVAHPFGEPNRAMSFTFDVPSNSWEGVSDPGQMVALLKMTPHNEGVGLGFLLVDSLNGDPCKWAGSDDDVEVGPTVDDLVAALTSSDDFETSEPEDVTLGRHSGKKLVITMPATLQDPRTSEDPEPGCSEGIYRIWNPVDGSGGFDIFAQGAENHWMTWIMDVEGTRAVIFMSYFDHSDGPRVAELQSIAESIEITSP